jgi:peptidyl-prolyl cis-trans isomerase B (cyclophilin B)
MLRRSEQREQNVLIRTTEGDITVRLFNETPLHRDNFISLVRSGFYDGTNFHRVISEFMIQGGDTSTRENAPVLDFTVPAEIRTPQIYHRHGALAAARLADAVNPERASSSHQFYIVVGRRFTYEQLDSMQIAKIERFGHANDSTFKFNAQARIDYTTIGGTPHLDGLHTVFGEVVSGMEVVKQISEVETNEQNRPIEEVRILEMRLLRRNNR